MFFLWFGEQILKKSKNYSSLAEVILLSKTLQKRNLKNSVPHAYFNFLKKKVTKMPFLGTYWTVLTKKKINFFWRALSH